VFLKGLVALGLVAALFAAPAQAQTQDTTKRTARDAKAIEQQRKEVEGMQFDFVDSSEAYWVTRGLNDTLYNAGGSVNSVNLERDQVRQDAKLSKMYKPPEVVEVRVQGKKVGPMPNLKINGKVVQP
jgi:hypothetical protein